MVKPGKHLAFDSPQLASIRLFIERCVEQGTDRRLIGNFDQVWSTLYMPEKSLLWKDPKELGVRPENLSVAKQKLRKALTEALGKPVAESAEDKTWAPPKNSAANLTTVVNEWRVPRPDQLRSSSSLMDFLCHDF